MRDHVRILGILFMAWGIARFAAVIAFAAGWRVNAPISHVPGFTWILLLLGGALYLWAGWNLRQHNPRIRTPAVLLAIIMLFEFPVGTAIGIYGIWIFFGRKELTAT